MQLAALDLRKGTLVRYNNQMCFVASWNILRNDRRQFVQMKLKELKTGRMSELKEHGDTKFEVLDNSTVDVSHSYREGDMEVFYSEDGTEYRCPVEAAEDALQWAQDSYKGLLVDGELVTVSVPSAVVVTVKQTDPPIKGGGNLLKEATLENGVVVRVSGLVASGDKVKIDPETLEFKERV